MIPYSSLYLRMLERGQLPATIGTLLDQDAGDFGASQNVDPLVQTVLSGQAISPAQLQASVSAVSAMMNTGTDSDRAKGAELIHTVYARSIEEKKRFGALNDFLKLLGQRIEPDLAIRLLNDEDIPFHNRSSLARIMDERLPFRLLEV